MVNPNRFERRNFGNVNGSAAVRNSRPNTGPRTLNTMRPPYRSTNRTMEHRGAEAPRFPGTSFQNASHSRTGHAISRGGFLKGAGLAAGAVAAAGLGLGDVAKAQFVIPQPGDSEYGVYDALVYPTGSSAQDKANIEAAFNNPSFSKVLLKVHKENQPNVYTAFNLRKIEISRDEEVVTDYQDGEYVRINRGVVIHGEPVPGGAEVDFNTPEGTVTSNRAVVFGGGASEGWWIEEVGGDFVVIPRGAFNLTDLTGSGHIEISNLMFYKSGYAAIHGMICYGALISNNIVKGMIPLPIFWKFDKEYYDAFGLAIVFQGLYYIDEQLTFPYCQGNIIIQGNQVLKPEILALANAGVIIVDIGIKELEDLEVQPKPVSFVIRNNFIDQTCGTSLADIKVHSAIFCAGGHDQEAVRVENNICTVPPEAVGINFGSGHSDFTFSNGVIKGNQIHMLPGASAGLKCFSEMGIGEHTVADNRIYGEGEYGINVESTKNIVFSGNDLSGLTAMSQVYCDGNHNTFKGNKYGSAVFAGAHLLGSNITLTNENFLGNYPGWELPYTESTGLGCILLDGVARNCKITALKNGVAMHGFDLCNQVLDLPEYDEEGEKTISIVQSELYGVAPGEWFGFPQGFAYIYAPDWSGGYPGLPTIVNQSYFGFGSAGFADLGPTSGYAFEREDYITLVGYSHYIFLGDAYALLAMGDLSPVKTDGSGEPLKIPKNNDVPGYEKCLVRSGQFIQKMQAKARELTNKLKQRRLEKWGSLYPPGRQ